MQIKKNCDEIIKKILNVIFFFDLKVLKDKNIINVDKVKAKTKE
tara:strand:- start:323 stop:454 length:132 start_codon:yes stop_codon:yes gene_type:complete